MSNKIVIAKNFPDTNGNTDHLGYEVAIGKLSNEQLLEIVELLETGDIEHYLDSEYFQEYYNFDELYHGNGIAGNFGGLSMSNIDELKCEDKDELSTFNWNYDSEAGVADERQLDIDADIIIVTYQAEDKYFCVEQELQDDDKRNDIPIQLKVDYIDRLTNLDWNYLDEDIEIKPCSFIVGAKSEAGDFEINSDYWDGDENKYTKYQFIMKGEETILAVSNRGTKHWNGSTIDFVCAPFSEGELCPANSDEDLLSTFITSIKTAINSEPVESSETNTEKVKSDSKIKKAWDEDGKTINKLIEKYNYQPALTEKLDNLKNGIIDEKTLLEIFLWKTDRYPDLDKIDFIKLNSLNSTKPENFRECEEVLRDLISIKGFGLAMASTILRFRNPQVFPIIDRRAYRVLMDDDKLSIHHATSIDKQIDIYFNYVEKVHQFVKEKGVDLSIVDRVLYIFDKEANKGTKI